MPSLKLQQHLMGLVRYHHIHPLQLGHDDYYIVVIYIAYFKVIIVNYIYVNVIVWHRCNSMTDARTENFNKKELINLVEQVDLATTTLNSVRDGLLRGLERLEDWEERQAR